MPISSFKKVSEIFKGCQFRFLESDIHLDTDKGIPAIDLLRKIEDFCWRYKQKTEVGKLNYPAYYIKGKNGAYLRNMCLEPSFNRVEHDYSYYRGIYIDFEFSSIGTSYVDIYVDGEVTLHIDKSNLNILQMSDDELVEKFEINSSIKSTVDEIDEYANGDIYIDRFIDEHTIYDLNYVIIKKLSSIEKRMIEVFFDCF